MTFIVRLSLKCSNVTFRSNVTVRNIACRVRDYREPKRRYRNYVITFRVIAPLKCNAPVQFFLSCQIIDLEFVYPNLLFKVFYDDKLVLL